MIDLPVLPSRLLRATAFVARWVWGMLLAVAFLLLASWGLLHGWIVPRISDYRPAIERQASQALGLPVRIGGISAKTLGLVPSFELTDVALLDPHAHDTVALRLPRVVVALSPRSVLRLGFEQLYIDRPELDIRRAQDGHVFVAGLDVGGSHSDTRLQKWFFDQRELVIHQGLVRWTDEQRAAPPLALSGVNVLVRNTVRRHALHLDATVPALAGEEGSHFSVNARFRQPLLGRSTGDWRDWTGQAFAYFAHIDVSRLRQYVATADAGWDVTQGDGALRLWVDVAKGRVTSATADVALAEVSARLGTQTEPLTLRTVTGRLSGQRQSDGFAFATQGLQFVTQEGHHWPGGNIAVAVKGRKGELHADQLDLAALAQVANLLPLDATARATLKSYAPQGLVEKVEAHWVANPSNVSNLSNATSVWPAKFDAKGRVSGLSLASGFASPKPGRPGIDGATVDFELTPAGGKATLAVQSGSASFPGVFDDPLVKFEALTADVAWQLQPDKRGDKVAVQAKNIHFANADAAGEAQVSWHTGDPTKSRFPGVVDITGSLSRGNLAQLHRYLPLVLPPKARDYVRASVQQGRVTEVKFRVKGDMHDIPFRDPRLGEFAISAKLNDGVYAYVPASPGSPALWPSLTQLSGDIAFAHVGMQLHVASSRIDGLPGLLVTKADASIPDLAQAVVQLAGEGKGPLGEALALVNRTPVGQWTGQALAQASATGMADVKLRLSLPLHELDKAKVQGSVLLAGNDFQLNPGLPPFSRARGSVSFSESSFGLQAVQAGFLGGELRVEGGTADATALQFRALGTASAEGLRQAHELGSLATFARYASGSTSYTATLALRRGRPELTVQTNLQGLALALPPPFNKAAEAELPLRYENTLVNASLPPGVDGTVPLQDQLRLTLRGAVPVDVLYQRDLSAPEPQVLRGTVNIGLTAGEAARLPESGVAANLQLGEVDVDAWSALLNTPVFIAENSINTGGKYGFYDYMPTEIALRANELRLGGHALSQLVLGGSRVGLTWRANVAADEGNGYLEYRQSSPGNAGRVHARLARLTIAPSAATQVEALLKAQPASIPALDIVVDDLDLRGKKLGRVEVVAVNVNGNTRNANTPPEWRLNTFNITLPEARFTATGQWVADATSPGTTAAAPRHTAMNYTLDITNAGDLLARFGMKDVVRKGHGQLAGQVSWAGSPLALDYPSLGGQFHVNVETGQFLKADPGIAKLLGVLSLQSLPRRLLLDFRDVFSEGFAFDFLRGDVTIHQGIATTNNVQMKGVNAAVLLEGQADIAQETQDLKAVVVPEIDAGTASLVASVINPLVGITSFLTQVVLRRPLIEAATQEFHVDGSWAEPRVVRVERRAAH